jgi:hypothetical protein
MTSRSFTLTKVIVGGLPYSWIVDGRFTLYTVDEEDMAQVLWEVFDHDLPSDENVFNYVVGNVLGRTPTEESKGLAETLKKFEEGKKHLLVLWQGDFERDHFYNVLDETDVLTE